MDEIILSDISEVYPITIPSGLAELVIVFKDGRRREISVQIDESLAGQVSDTMNLITGLIDHDFAMHGMDYMKMNRLTSAIRFLNVINRIIST